jgi:uncharacterized OsmC-like protein
MLMPGMEKIRTAMERITRTLKTKPSFGLGTGISKTTITNGLTCEVKEGNWTLTADMPEQVGGNGAGPTPGVYGRAALGSCLAIGYMMRAAVMGINIRHLEVEVQADYDDGALFGTTTSIPPGYIEVRYSVKVDSEATEDQIIEMIESADKVSPYLDIFTRGQTCKRTILITSPKEP